MCKDQGHTSIENIVYTEFTEKKVSEQLTLAVVSSSRLRIAFREQCNVLVK